MPLDKYFSGHFIFLSVHRPNENYKECHHRKTSCTFYIYKKKKNVIHFYIQKSRHLAKSKTIYDTFISTKSHTLFITLFFMNFLKLAFILKNHDTLRYVMFYIQKDRQFEKRKTICVTFLYTKIRPLFVSRFFIEFLKLAERGGGVVCKKTLCVTFLYEKTVHFSLRWFIQKS